MEFDAPLGGKCRQSGLLEALFRTGMTGARLNLSHTTLAHCADLLQAVFYPAARSAGVEPHLIIDLQGPELRVGTLPQPVPLEEGGRAVLGEGGIPVPPALPAAARPGDRVSLDDSALLLEVEKAEEGRLVCRVVQGGLLRSRKSLALLGVEVDAPALTPADLDNLDLAGALGVTHILQPFVRGREDVLALRRALDERGLGQIQIMAKIENRAGVEHLDEIMAHADQICIARGDLGNSMPLWELPGVQKDISRRCREAGAPFCLVTQLLWSMEQRAVPTRAEVCDIYNGVLDGASSLMLTGETAVGKYPVQAMEYLVQTARQALSRPAGQPPL